jgi:Holliday junction resolvasome RuvABC ATP-dependent DNA helicase subunit
MPKTKTTTTISTNDEEMLFTSLRAEDWQEFTGQENIKKSLQIAIKPLSNVTKRLIMFCFMVLRLGKTTLSQLIAKEMGSNFKVTLALLYLKLAIWLLF